MSPTPLSLTLALSLLTLLTPTTAQTDPSTPAPPTLQSAWKACAPAVSEYFTLSTLDSSIYFSAIPGSIEYNDDSSNYMTTILALRGALSLTTAPCDAAAVMSEACGQSFPAGAGGRCICGILEGGVSRWGLAYPAGPAVGGEYNLAWDACLSCLERENEDQGGEEWETLAWQRKELEMFERDICTEWKEGGSLYEQAVEEGDLRGGVEGFDGEETVVSGEGGQVPTGTVTFSERSGLPKMTESAGAADPEETVAGQTVSVTSGEPEATPTPTGAANVNRVEVVGGVMAALLGAVVLL